MKKIALILAIMIAAALTYGGGVASAATCFGNLNGIYYDGQWASDAELYGCDHVNGVQFQGSEGSLTGIAWPLHARDYATSSPGQTQTGSILFANWFYTFRVPVFGPGCGAPAISVQSHFGWRIRNSVGNTWGSWHQTISGYQSIC